jgi:fructose-bisphosphate aldolase / 2-amino-3,7-dideoxy-D-threo-hept-6-ulosonate synthase
MVRDVGKDIRLNRIFRKSSNRTFIVAMDHGSADGPLKGIESPAETITKLIKGGADALLTTTGVVRSNHSLMAGDISFIMRISGSGTPIGPEGLQHHVSTITRSVESAIKMGADAVAVTAFIGCPGESAMLQNLNIVAENCEDWGMPLLAEMIPVTENPYSEESVSMAARVGAELGADIIKTYYTGTPETFREVVKKCYVPVVILGGPKTSDEMKMLESIDGALKAGGRGVAFGRNVWQHPDPMSITRAICSIIHKGATVEEASRALHLK